MATFALISLHVLCLFEDNSLVTIVARISLHLLCLAERSSWVATFAWIPLHLLCLFEVSRLVATFVWNSLHVLFVFEVSSLVAIFVWISLHVLWLVLFLHASWLHDLSYSMSWVGYGIWLYQFFIIALILVSSWKLFPFSGIQLPQVVN